jgi:hypothetical protein
MFPTPEGEPIHLFFWMHDHCGDQVHEGTPHFRPFGRDFFFQLLGHLAGLAHALGQEQHSPIIVIQPSKCIDVTIPMSPARRVEARVARLHREETLRRDVPRACAKGNGRLGRKSRLRSYRTFDPVGLDVRWCTVEWGEGEAAPSGRPPCLSAGGSFRVPTLLLRHSGSSGCAGGLHARVR